MDRRFSYYFGIQLMHSLKHMYTSIQSLRLIIIILYMYIDTFTILHYVHVRVCTVHIYNIAPGGISIVIVSPLVHTVGINNYNIVTQRIFVDQCNSN